MDGKRFDALSKSVAVPATRRTALGGMVASSLLAAFGLKQAPVAAQEPTCVIDFAATVRQGPSANQTAGAVRGELSFGLSGKGNLENASLRLADGTSAPVVGQATGHSLQVRMQLANQALVAIGVGEREIAECQGAIDGLITGPAAGDLGDFHAVVVRSTGSLGDASGGQNADKGDKKEKNAAQQGVAEAGAATQGGEKKGGKKKADKNAGANAGGTQAPASGSGGSAGTTDATGSTGIGAQTGTCPAGQTDCRGTCVDLTTDPANCGACGTACGDAFCVSGACETTQAQTATCDPGLTDCGGSCVDLNANRSACGNCTTICAQTDDCVGGVCQPFASTCPNAGEIDCGGVCVNTATDTANCGSCGLVCTAGNQCSSGVCIAQSAPLDNCIPQGLTDCAGFCIDTATDAANCGACGVACAAGESCVGGACQAQAAPAAQTVTCPAGETNCGGVCTDLNNDFGNCGACGVACVAPQGCVGGQCMDQSAPPPTNCAAIGPTFIDCGGVCVDVQIDANNCGGCGVVCPNQCAGGVCV